MAVVEGYDRDHDADSILANISSRCFVDTGENVMIGGFFVGPDTASDGTVLLRAIGPSLSTAGITNPLQDPSLTLVDANANTLFSNDNWEDTQQAEIEATLVPPPNDKESAILATLPPGPYTAIVTGQTTTPVSAL